jgi:methylmalonyl-CoA mutase N-terminal domain/subunit
LQDGSIPKVGVNKYRIEEEARDVALHEYKPEQAEDAIRRTAQIRANRDQRAAAAALEKVREAAASGQNVMPAMMDAVRAYATLGEITAVLKQVFGVFREPVRL